MVLWVAGARGDTLTHKETGETFTGKVRTTKINDRTLVIKSDGKRVYLDLDEYEVVDDDLGEPAPEEPETDDTELADDEPENDADGASDSDENEEAEEREAETATAVTPDDERGEEEPDEPTGEDDGNKEAATTKEEESRSKNKTIDIELSDDVTMTLAYIPPGRFLMGSPLGEEGRDDDELQHPVIISRGFFMGVTEVTQEQFETVMGYSPPVVNPLGHIPIDPAYLGADMPVMCLRMEEANGFCEKLSKRPGRFLFRLPTEAEWEYAARAGTRGAYGGTGNIEDMGWIDMRRPKPVALKQPNAWGLYDMHGNVWEFTCDVYKPYKPGLAKDPRSKGSKRVGPRAWRDPDFWVSRGGTYRRRAVRNEKEWEGGAAGARSANRLEWHTIKGSSAYGFRVMAELKPRR